MYIGADLDFGQNAAGISHEEIVDGSIDTVLFPIYIALPHNALIISMAKPTSDIFGKLSNLVFFDHKSDAIISLNDAFFAPPNLTLPYSLVHHSTIIFVFC